MSCLPDVNFLVYILVMLFGMGSWVAVNGMWVELPILVDESPERWNLPSYITIIIQIANIGPFLYTLTNRIAPNKFHEKHGVYLLVVLGATGSLLLVFFWKNTTYVGGVKHSTGLLLPVFLLSLVDCTSSVVFLPYMSRFKPRYITALYIGEGMSGLVPSLVALGQGVGKTVCIEKIVNHTTNETTLEQKYEQPNFPVENFFYFLFAMMIVCGLAFTLLHYLPYCQQEHNDPDSNDGQVRFINADSASYKYTEFRNDSNSDIDSRCNILLGSKEMENSNRTQFFYFLFLIGCINALTNGVLPSVQSYACIPYGKQPYHLAATLSSIANPLACLIAFVLPVLSAKVIGTTTAVGCGLATYILVIASYSPAPPMGHHTIGAVLIVLSFVLVTAVMCFSKVSIAMALRMRGRQALLWCGIATQIGSALGAILMFVLVNTLHLFHDKQACS